MRQAIDLIEKQKNAAMGRKKALLTKHLIEMRKDQYVIKNAFKQPVVVTKVIRNFGKKLHLNENITINEKGEPESDGLISLFNPTHISCLLCNYTNLKKELSGKIENDFYYLINDFEKLINKTLCGDYAIYLDLIKLKFKDKTSKQIAEALL